MIRWLDLLGGYVQLLDGSIVGMAAWLGSMVRLLEWQRGYINRLTT